MQQPARSRSTMIVAAFLSCAAILPAGAQSAIFAGAVVRDTLGHGLSGAQITLLGATNRVDTTDARGEFKFTNLPAGRIGVVVRHIGFQPILDTVDLVNGRNPEREYVLDAAPVALDSVRVVAEEDRHVSPHLTQFESDRRASAGGHFITEQQIAANEQRALQDVIVSLVPGVHIFRPNPKQEPTKEYISSGRGGCNRPIFQCGASTECPVLIYLDGIVHTNPVSDPDPRDWDDFNTLRTADIQAVEYFAGGATVPQRYNMTGNGCGVLVLWTRDGPRNP